MLTSLNINQNIVAFVSALACQLDFEMYHLEALREILHMDDGSLNKVKVVFTSVKPVLDLG